MGKWSHARSRPGRGTPASWPVVAFLVSVAAAPVGAAAQAVSLDSLAGRYEFVGTVGGQTMEGSVDLRTTPSGGLEGELRLGALPPARVTGGAIRDGALLLTLALSEGEAEAEMRFGGTGSFTGEIRVGSDVVPIEGSRAAASEPLVSASGWLEAEIDRRAPGWLADAGEPGLAVAVVEDARIRWTRAWGVLDPRTGVAADSATIYQVGSISKTLTAWAVLRLSERGELDLDDPVNDHLRRWRVPAGEYDPREVTIRRLLSHTAGLNVPSISGVDLGDPVPTLVEELDGRGRGDEWAVHVVAPPGERFAYSGGGYMVLQLLIEDVTGRPFADYMRDEVLRPLGMERSSYGWPATRAGDVAMPTSPVAERDHRRREFAGLAGAGLYTTAADMARFLAAHFEGPAGEPAGRGVVSPEAIDLMTAPDPIARSYGLGYELYPPLGDIRIVGHGGSNVGWKANFLLLPDDGFGFAVLSNADEGAARREVLGLARDAITRVWGPR